MRNALLIAQREFRSYFRSPLGSIVAAVMLLLEGLLFQVGAMGGQGAGKAKLSAEVLSDFFYYTSGVTMIGAIALSMRLIAHEREKGTLILINTAPVKDREIVLGKFLALFTFLFGVTALTAYMPALIFVNGRVSVGHILVGYLGILLIGGAAVAIGLFASAFARTQVIAAVLGAAVLGVLLLLWMAAKVADAPVNNFLLSLAIHHERQRSFMLGTLRLENILYYVGVIYFFLLAATKTLEARRWR
ncbi:MAG TPA: ABC transporter permease [Polyangiaceae bacterium]|nr:ABC transporter permease [Polyangiaceae bacterium]